MSEKSDTRITRAVALADPETDTSGPCAAERPRYLIVVGGGVPGAMIRLSAEGDRVGRSGENTVRLADLSVSRRHARIAVGPRGTAWLTDVGSTNGTFLNNRRLEPFVAERLDDGDRVQFGSAFVAKFVCLDPTDERFQRELFERSVRDGLTGLYNRGYFLDRVGPTAESAAARGLGLAVLMLDVDHFKKVNDTYGHAAGDAVLREVAAVLRESTRSEDLVARYGGEEFILVLPVAAPDQAAERAERVRAEIAARRVAVTGSDTPLRVTASLGLAFSRPPAHAPLPDPEALIHAADQALYQAKNAGRNRIVFRPVSSAELTDSELVTPYHSGT
jgi:diguanylate cyclase (GGDEF)-like protein